MNHDILPDYIMETFIFINVYVIYIYISRKQENNGSRYYIRI
jgi:hypothetical protein